MESNLPCANASGCSGSSNSVSASLVRSWPEQIRRGRSRIKKTPQAEGGRYGGSVGSGRSALSAARIALPHVDSAGDQRSHCVSSSHAKERRLLCCRASAGRHVYLPPGNGKVQRRDLLAVSEIVLGSQLRSRPPRSGHQRQRSVPSLQTRSEVGATSRLLNS